MVALDCSNDVHRLPVLSGQQGWTTVQRLPSLNSTQTSINQKVNGHRIEIRAISTDGASFSEKELRSIEEYLEQRGFKGYVDIKRVDWLERLGLRMFGK